MPMVYKVSQCVYDLFNEQLERNDNKHSFTYNHPTFSISWLMQNSTS